MTRWTLVISEDTDRALRVFLARNGGKKGDLSEFVENAVKEKLFHLTVSGIKERNRDFEQDDLMNLFDEAITDVRAATPHP
jgi:hypothetical protein